MTVANIMMAMASEKTRNPSSDAHDFKVYPRILNPWECLENLNIRKTRKTRSVTKAPETSSLSLMINPI